MKILSKLPKEILAIMLVVNQDLKLEIMVNMKKYGGSFVKCLADSLQTADPRNTMRLVVAFEDYIKKYLPENWE